MPQSSLSSTIRAPSPDEPANVFVHKLAVNIELALNLVNCQRHVLALRIERLVDDRASRDDGRVDPRVAPVRETLHILQSAPFQIESGIDLGGRVNIKKSSYFFPFPFFPFPFPFTFLAFLFASIAAAILFHFPSPPFLYNLTCLSQSHDL